MGRKKKKTIKPWCWYCNREFDDDKVLAFHQKAKHFKCHVCYKKLFSAPGLAIHCSQVHKDTITHVPNAISGRDNIEVEIFGMEGIPEADRIAHELQKIGRADVQEPDLKRPKMMGLPGMIMAPPPGMMYPLMPGMVPPGGMQIMPGMVPLPMGGAPPMMMMNPRPLPGGHLGMPPQPLFPGGAPPPLRPRGPPLPMDGPPKPTFPAYQNLESPATTACLPDAPARQASKVPSVGAGCKLIHPEDDLSMEEIRGQLPKYRTAKPSLSGGSTVQNSSFVGGAPPMIRPGMSPTMMMIRPGMGPPPSSLRPPLSTPTC